MSTTVLIVLGVLGWILLATGLALFLGRMIRLRDRHARAAEAPPESPNGDAGIVSRDRPDRD
jgi:hypothetical protein